MKVFISRDLKENSPFLTILNENDIEVEGCSMLRFKAHDFQLPETFSWVFFYSRTGVEYFFKADLRLGNCIHYAAIGPATAEAVKSFGHKVEFCGDGNPESTAAAFLNCAAGQDVLFVRAKESNRSVQKLLEGRIISHEIIVYENSPKEDVKCTDADWMVFTSSLNAKAYFAKCRPYKNQKFLAIGTPTAETLYLLGIKDLVISERPDESSMAKTLLNQL